MELWFISSVKRKVFVVHVRLFFVVPHTQAIQTELNGARDIDDLYSVIVEIASGVLLVLFNELIVSTWALGVSGVSVVIVSFLMSTLFFASGYLWLNFATVMAAAWLHCLFEHFHRHHTLEHELSERKVESENQASHESD